ncbi:hypothetical protein AB0G81_28625 [Streptomyces asoensis]|uniref:hypothetical protein n=1 Tax=Streptomyces asoensis TaxID=249586 RepID=UPI0033E964E1
MTWPTALPAAALRVLRGAAGRRVLQLGLLVAGLFAAGFLCGEQAHAAGGPPAPATATVRLPHPAAPATADPGAAAGPRVTTALSGVTGQSAAAKAPGVTELSEATGPSGSRPGPAEVTDAPADVPRLSGLPVLSDLPDLPALPTLPAPALPTLPALPSLPALPDLPGLPASPALPVPPVLAELPALPVIPAAPARTLPVPVVGAPGGRTAAAGADTDVVTVVDAVAGTESYGPVGLGGGQGGGHAARDGDRVAPVHVGQARGQVPGPVRRGPAGGRDAVLNGVPVLDGGVSRHGDAHAVTASLPVPPRLVPGGAVRRDVTGTRDRRHDVPVFPG